MTADGPPNQDIVRLEAGRAGRPRNWTMAEIAGRQHGLISLSQLRGVGLGVDAVHERMKAGRLFPVFRGVYSVGHPTLSRDGRLMAAVIACGKAALVSHRSAAPLWGLGEVNGP